MRGIGSMLHQLKGGTPHGSSEYAGKKIADAKLVNDSITIEFSDGKKIKIFDDGQSCCESRYITCDDDLSSLVGQTLKAIEVKKFENKDAEYEEHEIAFIEIQGDRSSVTFCTHNEHNGYYGGFGLSIDELS